MEVNGQIRAATALTLWKQHMHWIGGWVSPTVRLNSVEESNVGLPNLQPGDIPTELSLLLQINI